MLESIDNKVVVLEGPYGTCKHIELRSKLFDHLPHYENLGPDHKFIYYERLRYIDHVTVTGKCDPLYEELLFSTDSSVHLYKKFKSARLLESDWLGENDESNQCAGKPRTGVVDPFSDEALMFFEDTYPR